MAFQRILFYHGVQDKGQVLIFP